MNQEEEKALERFEKWWEPLYESNAFTKEEMGHLRFAWKSCEKLTENRVREETARRCVDIAYAVMFKLIEKSDYEFEYKGAMLATEEIAKKFGMYLQEKNGED